MGFVRRRRILLRRTILAQFFHISKYMKLCAKRKRRMFCIRRLFVSRPNQQIIVGTTEDRPALCMECGARSQSYAGTPQLSGENPRFPLPTPRSRSRRPGLDESCEMRHGGAPRELD